MKKGNDDMRFLTSIFSRILYCLPVKMLDKMKITLDGVIFRRHGSVEIEQYDYYSATTAFAYSNFKRILDGRIRLFSLAGKVEHITPMMGVCDSVFHLSMMPFEDADDLKSVISDYDNMVIKQGDFFLLEKNEVLEQVNALVSHATIHCMNDTRYNNTEKMGGGSFLFGSWKNT